MAVRIYARSRVFSTRIARIYASRPWQVTSDIVCSWTNRFYLTVGVWPIPGADAPLFTRYTRIRVYCTTPPVHHVIFFSLSLFLLFNPPSPFIPWHLVYSTLYCPTGPCCGRASAPHLHPVKRRKLVKARAVICRIREPYCRQVTFVWYSPVPERQSTRRGICCVAFRIDLHLTEINVLISLSRPDMLMSW